MSPFAFDTLSASKQLREAGMSEGVAEAVVSVFQHAATMPDISHLATKADLEAHSVATRADLETHSAAMRAEFESFRAATKADIGDMATKSDLELLRLATKADFEALRLAAKADFETLRLATKAEIDALRSETRADIAALRSETGADIAALRKEMATKDDLAQVRLDVANFRASMTDTIRQQGWLMLGGVGVLLTISNGITKLLG